MYTDMATSTLFVSESIQSAMIASVMDSRLLSASQYIATVQSLRSVVTASGASISSSSAPPPSAEGATISKLSAWSSGTAPFVNIPGTSATHNAMTTATSLQTTPTLTPPHEKSQVLPPPVSSDGWNTVPLHERCSKGGRALASRRAAGLNGVDSSPGRMISRKR